MAVDPTLREQADRRFEQALKESGARDPREFYRTRLRELKQESAEAYRRALDYFEQRLVPAVARDGSDPLAEWLEYGRVLATLSASGRTVAIDATGLARDYARPVPADSLVVHLPEQASRPAIPVGIPAKLSPAQRATYDLLVKGALGS